VPQVVAVNQKKKVGAEPGDVGPPQGRPDALRVLGASA